VFIHKHLDRRKLFKLLLQGFVILISVKSDIMPKLKCDKNLHM